MKEKQREMKKIKKKLKGDAKEKLTKIMKKNKEEFVSAEFSACWLGSPFGHGSDVV